MNTEEKTNTCQQTMQDNTADATAELKDGNTPDTQTEDTASDETQNQPEESAPEVDPLTAAQEEIAELKKQLLYKAAEFDNFRKRVLKEKADLSLNGGERVITAILPVMDDLERALEQMQKAENVQAVTEGVSLIQKKFLSILEKQGVTPIETKDADFDVELHEAVAQFPAPSPEMKNKVVDCTLKGYKLNEKVIRHSQVVVGI